MRADNNFILNELVKHRHKLQRLNNYRYTYNRQQLLCDYVDKTRHTLLPIGEEVVERFEVFKRFLQAVGPIRGRTDVGRIFTLEYLETSEIEYNRYGTTNEPTAKFYVRILDAQGNVYEPRTQISDIMNYSILSAVNKYETHFFHGSRKPIKTGRTIIHAKGTYDSLPFRVAIEIMGTNVSGIWKYDGQEKTLYLTIDIPSHIPEEQHHKYKARTLASNVYLQEQLKNIVKSNYMKCCGMSISADDKFCSRCGREFVVEEVLVIDDIKTTNLETLLS